MLVRKKKIFGHVGSIRRSIRKYQIDHENRRKMLKIMDFARSGQNWRAGARALEFSKSMNLQLSNAVSDTFPRPLVVFLLQFEILHENRKKSHRKCPGVS